MSTGVAKAGKRIPDFRSGRPAEDRRARRPAVSVLWIAEDDVSYHGIPVLLMKVPNVSGIAVGRDVAEAGSLYDAERFDLVVTPLAALPEFLERVALRIRQKILVTVRKEEVRTASSAIQTYGVDGCLLWDEINVARLTGTFEQVISGDVPVPSSVQRGPLAAGERRGPDRSAHPARVTEREHAVLALLLQGMSNNQIARAMGISIHGVKRHVSNLLVKFGCANRTEVALAAQRLGMDAPSRVRRTRRRAT
ncbi:response regulator transcription factor [Microbispora triticiradicis]|uniref:Response regulator transcription factor n=2 Tax=Microbispora TaxID=2005 RepID=A0ABY3LR21_9ACTN|nr:MULTISPECIES: response regulator transcription factor [Microbispora]TLP54807.1 response regulator transcription factor [Microbispora fusca]TYB50732.1 response regulator transcription factor [Microbispora tritici]